MQVNLTSNWLCRSVNSAEKLNKIIIVAFLCLFIYLFKIKTYLNFNIL